MGIEQANRLKTRRSLAYGILIAWCMLPVIMSFYGVLTAATERFQPVISDTGNTMSLTCLVIQAMTYHFAFIVLGLISIGYSLYYIYQNRGKLIDVNMIKASPWLYSLFLVLVCSVISTILADDPMRALCGERYRYTGLGSFFVFGGVFIVSTTISSEEARKNIIRLYCGVITYLSILVIIQVYADTILDVSLTSDLACVFLQHNHFGYLLCMGIVGSIGLYLFDSDSWLYVKLLYILCLAIMLFALMLNSTLGSYIASIFGTLFIYVIHHFRKRNMNINSILPIFIFIFISSLDLFITIPVKEHMSARLVQIVNETIGQPTSNFNETEFGMARGFLWKQTLERIIQRPIFGFGPDGFYGKNAITWTDMKTPEAPHNEFLQMAGYTGLPSLAFYLMSMITLGMHHIKNLKRLDPMTLVSSGVLVTYLISACAGNPIFNTAPYYWLFFGISAVSVNSGGRSTTTSEMTHECITRITKNAKFLVKRFLIIPLLMLVAIAILFTYSVFKGNEYIAEYADLLAMYNAELCYKSGHEDVYSNKSDYWYDPMTYRLTPINEEAPSPYGIGTQMIGEASENFEKQYGLAYNYDEKLDYNSKVIAVRCREIDQTGRPVIEWVDANKINNIVM